MEEVKLGQECELVVGGRRNRVKKGKEKDNCMLKLSKYVHDEKWEGKSERLLEGDEQD